MIVVNDDSPRWLRELNRFLSLKSLLFVHGNILDLVSFPVHRPESDDIVWTDDELPGFLCRYLTGAGYKVVGFVDPVDGLTFTNPGMESIYNDLRRGRSPKKGKDAPDDPGEPTGSPGFDQGYTARPENAPPGTAGASAPAVPDRPVQIDYNNLLRGIRTTVRNNKIPSAFVFKLASRLISSPGHIVRDERSLLTNILKASLECSDVFGKDGAYHRNVIILVCDKLNDLPPFLYVNNPRARAIHIDRPDSNERVQFLQRMYQAFHGAESSVPPPELVGRFAALTDGLTNYELMSLVHLSRGESIEINNIENICQRYKYGVKESEWDKLDRGRLAGAEQHIRSRVKGQEAAIARVVDIVKRARVGLAAGQKASGTRPRGVLFFAGPTGVGKTEMAKSLAELLFGQEDRCIRFDMSEYSAPQSDEKLLGAPPGYVGYEEGGQLTNALKNKPFSILLFDEIEKAHGGIFDKFLQILDDGRLTDGKGDTVYFSETIIIFTSNLGAVSREEGPEGRKALVHPGMPYSQMREIILDSIRDHFNYVLGRPEILNRFGDNFVVFDFIKPPVDEEIVDLMISGLVKSTRGKWDIDLVFSSSVRDKIVSLARERLHHGGRGIRNLVDSALVNPLTRYLFDRMDSPEGKDSISGAGVNITELVDNGPEAPYRFELQGEVIKE